MFIGRHVVPEVSTNRTTKMPWKLKKISYELIYTTEIKNKITKHEEAQILNHSGKYK